MSDDQRPNFYQRLEQRHGPWTQAVQGLGQAVRAAGPLDERSLQLIQLGAAAALRSEGAVHSHVRRALAAGASADEIRHAIIAVTSTAGFPQVVAALSWAEDMLGGE